MGNTPSIVVGGAVGDYAGNHGDTSPGSNGTETDYFFPGNGTGVIVTSRAALNPDGFLRSGWRDRVTLAMLRDGSSNTFLAGEMHIPDDQINTIPFNGPLYSGSEIVAHSRIGGPGVPILSGREESGPIFGFGSAHPGICNFVRADGSTGSVNSSLDTLVLANLCNRSDGEVLDQE